VVIHPNVHGDARGHFVETFSAERYRDEAGIDVEFVQDNLSRSGRGVLRGLHAQKERPQGKLVRVARGEVFDVAADIDPDSATFGRWFGAMLTGSNQHQMWIPAGYAHGFLVVSDIADFEYKCTEYYHPGDEIGVVWNDPDIGIEWPMDQPILSEKDRMLPALADFGRGA
jgi:dTDP-4-dehydrorhamnose 3,5-epimerase